MAAPTQEASMLLVFPGNAIPLMFPGNANLLIGVDVIPPIDVLATIETTLSS